MSERHLDAGSSVCLLAGNLSHGSGACGHTNWTKPDFLVVDVTQRHRDRWTAAEAVASGKQGLSLLKGRARRAFGSERRFTQCHRWFRSEL
jgi:hypothetical protein